MIAEAQKSPMSFGSTGKIPKQTPQDQPKESSYYDEDGFSEDEEESSSKDGVKRAAFNLDSITDDHVTAKTKVKQPVGASNASADELSTPQASSSQKVRPSAIETVLNDKKPVGAKAAVAKDDDDDDDDDYDDDDW